MRQIDSLHARLGRADSLADYVRGLAAVGVVRCDSFVLDGHSEFHGGDGQVVVSTPSHEVLVIAEEGDLDAAMQALRLHSNGQSSYIEMSRGLASSGVEKWSIDTSGMTMTYYNRAGAMLLVEQVQ